MPLQSAAMFLVSKAVQNDFDIWSCAAVQLIDSKSDTSKAILQAQLH
jgi:hypothetical protein